MPHSQLADGLYLVKQNLPGKGFQHYGVLDIGNRFGHPEVLPGAEPLVVHQPRSGLRVDWLRSTGAWELVAPITDEKGARERIDVASKTPNYDLFGNNCEHFARFVATGKRESSQVAKAIGIAAGLAALTWVLAD